MKKPTLADILHPYGITSPQALHAVIRPVKRPPYTEDYAKRLYRGILPMSKKVATAIREYTRGGLTLDALIGPNGR